VNRRRACLSFFASLLLILSYSHIASAEPEWLTAFALRYPSAIGLVTCGVCHRNFNGDGPRNPYGEDWKDAGGKNNPNAGFAAIENQDADGDGTSNLNEILTDDGFFPGWSCANRNSAVNAPGNLADFVDPTDPGCLGGGTTTTTTSSTSSTSSTSTSSTSSTSSTTTTLPGGLKCAQPISSGALPVASDCLYILGTAVGTQSCAPDPCVCDPSGDGNVVATDALLCLNNAVGISAPLNCPCSGGGDPVAGEQIYDTDCGFCHSAGAHDPVSEFASDLAGDGALLVGNLGTLDPSMTGILLTEQEIADLAAFLDGL
jgi:hypothetical protein